METRNWEAGVARTWETALEKKLEESENERWAPWETSTGLMVRHGSCLGWLAMPL